MSLDSVSYCADRRRVGSCFFCWNLWFLLLDFICCSVLEYGEGIEVEEVFVGMLDVDVGISELECGCVVVFRRGKCDSFIFGDRDRCVNDFTVLFGVRF